MSRGRGYKALQLLGMWAVFVHLLLHPTLNQQERQWREEENCMDSYGMEIENQWSRVLLNVTKKQFSGSNLGQPALPPLCCADQCPWHRSQEVCIRDDRRWGGHETRHPEEGQSWHFLVALKSSFICLEMWDFLFFFCEILHPWIKSEYSQGALASWLFIILIYPEATRIVQVCSVIQSS